MGCCRHGCIQPHLGPGFEIGLGRLFALLQIGVGLGPVRSGHAKGRAPHSAARREAQNQPRTLIGAAVMDRIDAKGATTAMENGGSSLYKGKTRAPHQGAIAKDPAIALIL